MKFAMSILVALLMGANASAATMKRYFKNDELVKIIEAYSKASGQKFVVDPSVRGKISIFNQDEVSIEEAFNQLSSALAVNGFAISKQGDMMVVRQARNVQRDLIEVASELPPLKPERMVTWVAQLKNVSAETVNRELRILLSKDGELSVVPASNQLIFTDWSSNLGRVSELLKQIDKPMDPEVAKALKGKKKKTN